MDLGDRSDASVRVAAPPAVTADHSINAEAYSAYLLGNQFYDRGNVDGYTARGWLRSVFFYEWAMGKADFEKARLLDPGNCTVQHYYARLMGSFGGLEEAIAAHKNATELDPLSAWAWSHLGREYSSNAQFQEAREAFDRALTVSPEFAVANCNLGNLELLEGRAPEAVLPFQRAGGMWSHAGAASRTTPSSGPNGLMLIEMATPARPSFTSVDDNHPSGTTCGKGRTRSPVPGRDW